MSDDVLLLQTRERDWSMRIAADLGGSTEHRTPDGSFIDVLTADTAYEVEWALKWKEGIGQSLYYGLATGLRPGLVLLMQDFDRDKVYYLRALAVCAKNGIHLVVRDARE